MHFTKQQLAWNYIHSFITMVLKPLSFLILAKLVTPEDYGLITIALIIVSFVEMIREVGFTESYIKLYHSSSIFSSTLFIFSVISGMVIYTCIYIFSPFFITIIDIKHSDLLSIIQIVSAQILLSSISSIYQANIIKNHNYKLLTKIEILPSLTPFFVSIPLAFHGLGAWALITGLLTASIIKTVLLVLSVNLKIKLEFDFKMMKETLIFMRYIFLESFLNWFYVWGDKAILTNFVTLAQLGLYTVATQIINLIYGFSFSITKMNYTHLCNLRENISSIRQYVLNYINISVFLSILLYFSLYFFADLLPFVIGDKWSNIDHVIILLGVSYSLSYTITTIVPDALKSINKPHIMPKIQFLKLLYTIPVFILSAHYFGFNGFLIGKIITVSIGTVIFYLVAHQHLGLEVKEVWRNIDTYIYIAFFAFSVQLIFTLYFDQNTLFSSLLFLILYMGLVYKFNKKTFYVLINFLRKK